jgi:HlyD family secretion protein
LAPQAEFTPPVLYNRENRAKLVFMIEAVFEAGAGVELQPGQPVDVAR